MELSWKVELKEKLYNISMSHDIICVCNIISIKMYHYYLEGILEISYENKLLYTVLYVIITTNEATHY